MERVVDCPVCYDKDTCFEDMQDTFNSYMCFNCGFMSNSHYTEGNTDKVESSTKLIQDLKFFDEERKIYWFPSVVNMGKLGIIYPEGSVDNWGWRFAVPVPVSDEEKESYPIPGKDGEFYTEKLDVNNAMVYGQYEFLKACQAMGIVGNNLHKNPSSAEA